VASPSVSAVPVKPFVDAGFHSLVPPPKEGLPASNGFGVLGVIKNPPHPNAAKIFVNWFLSKEGQDWYGGTLKTARAVSTSTPAG
jgi:ABC-type Fe3+ transport system substrate-binding protein